jgi:hypothetical protein
MRLFVAVLLAPLLGGCAISYNMPVSRFDSPEAEGRSGAVRLDIGVGSNNTVVLTPDFVTTAITTTSPTIVRDDLDLRAAGSYSVTERLELDLKGALADKQAYFLQGKYQLMGEPRSAAPEDNLSLSATAAVGGRSATGTGTGVFSQDKVNYELRGAVVDFALILGRRLGSRTLVYGGPFLTSFGYSGSREVVPTSGTATRQDFNGTSSQVGANVGLQLDTDDRKNSFKFEAALVSAKAGATQSEVRGHVGVIMAFHLKGR